MLLVSCVTSLLDYSTQSFALFCDKFRWDILRNLSPSLANLSSSSRFHGLQAYALVFSSPHRVQVHVRALGMPVSHVHFGFLEVVMTRTQFCCRLFEVFSQNLGYFCIYSRFFEHVFYSFYFQSLWNIWLPTSDTHFLYCVVLVEFLHNTSQPSSWHISFVTDTMLSQTKAYTFNKVYSFCKVLDSLQFELYSQIDWLNRSCENYKLKHMTAHQCFLLWFNKKVSSWGGQWFWP